MASHISLAFEGIMGWLLIKDLSQSESNLANYEKIHVTVLVLDQSNTLSFAAAVDPMRAANRHAGQRVFDWRFATPQQVDVALTSGLTIPAAPLNRVGPCDLLIVVASFDIMAQSSPALHASLRRIAGAATYIAGVDGGPWIMAQSGLLDGHSATVHWEDIDAFATQFPAIDTVNSRYQISGNRMTSAGATPTLDMMLALIHQTQGPALANQVAASFILDQSPAPTDPQSRNPDPFRHNPITARVSQLMEGRLDEPLPLAQIAKQVGMSQRVLQLNFKAQLQTTPQKHYLALRLAEAARLVRTTHRALLDIALATGFTSQSSFARAYKTAFGISARAQRDRGISKASDAYGGPHQSQPKPHRLG
jgi:transcriptional regulator GlxA family with amidase domain